jgi:hypothetical protein
MWECPKIKDSPEQQPSKGKDREPDFQTHPLGCSRNGLIQWIEEILHQWIGGKHPIIGSVSAILLVVQNFLHPP